MYIVPVVVVVVARYPTAKIPQRLGRNRGKGEGGTGRGTGREAHAASIPAAPPHAA